MAFVANTVDGRQGVFTGDGGPVTTVATTGPGSQFTGFGAFASNNSAGGVTFAAMIGGGQGIFTGADPVTDKVIRTGDALDGSTVLSVAFAPNAINDLGRGHNGKLQLQFNSRVWAGSGAWPGIANGSTFSDSGYQCSWEPTRAQPGTRGILNLYSGGNVTDAMRATVPFGDHTDTKVRQDAQTGLARISLVFPGLTAISSPPSAAASPSS